MRKLSPRRRRIAALGGGVAATSALFGTILHDHPTVRLAWLGVLVVVVGYMISEMFKLKKEQGCR
jgi:hypothetical protein